VKYGIANRNKAERNTMNNRILLYDFHLFDGEGAGADTASTAESQQDIKRVEYGRSEGEGSAPSQVGSDNGNEAQDRVAQWNAIKGEFKDLYGQDVSNAIQHRFKNQADLSGQIDQISNDLSPLFMNYGLKAGDFEGLKNAIANDDVFFQAQAERAGLDVEQYKENLRLKAEAERGRQITEAYEQQQRQNAMFAQWENEAAQLQQAFPGFDLGLEIQHNEEFAKLISNGVPVRNAFLTTHADEIFEGSNANASKVATQNVLNTIHQRASRPAEGAMHPGAALVRKSDPSSLSNDDIDEINRRVAMGESVSF
jgi:hypothetical protein